MNSSNANCEVPLSSVEIKEEPLDIEPEPEDLINPAENVKVELEEEQGVKLETNAVMDPLANVQVHYTGEASSGEPSRSSNRLAPSTSDTAAGMLKVQSFFSLRDGNESDVRFLASSSLHCRNSSFQTRSDVSVPVESYRTVAKSGVILPPEMKPFQPSNEFRDRSISPNVTGFSIDDLVSSSTDIVFGVKCFSCPFCKHFSRNRGSMKCHIYYKHRNSKKLTVASSTRYPRISIRTATTLNETRVSTSSTIATLSSPSINMSSSSVDPSLAYENLWRRPSPSSIVNPSSTSSTSINRSPSQSVHPSSSLSIKPPSTFSIDKFPTSIYPLTSLSIKSVPPIEQSPSIEEPITISICKSSSSPFMRTSLPSQSISPALSIIPSSSLTYHAQLNCDGNHNPTEIQTSIVIKKEVKSDTESLPDDADSMYPDNNLASDESNVKIEPSYDDELANVEHKSTTYDNPSNCFNGSGVSRSIRTSVEEERYEPVGDHSVSSKNQPDWLLDCETLFSNEIDDQELESSVVRVYGIKCYRCPRCDHLSRNLRQMRSHFISKHTIRRSVDRLMKRALFKCSNCPFNSTKMSEFKFHLTSVHTSGEFLTNRLEGVNQSQTPSDGESSMIRPPFNQHLKCSLCSFEASTTFELEAHTTTMHADLRSFQCKHCPFNTPNRDDFLGHLTEHEYTYRSKRHSTPRTLSKYKCEYCDYRSVKKRDLLNHVFTFHPPIASCS